MGRKKHQTKEKQKSNLTVDHIKLLQLADKLILQSTAALTPSPSKNLELQVEINALIEEVQSLENNVDASDSASTRSDDSILRFKNWLDENGTHYPNIQITEFPGYELGLKTDIDVEESNLIITLPQTLMLTLEYAKKSLLGPLIETDPLLSNMPNVALAMFLLLEKFKSNSFWKPYIDVLPATYSTVLYFTVDDLRELQASPTLEVALKQIRTITRHYAYFYKLIWSWEHPVCELLRKHFTFNQYRWAVSTIMTRQNTIPSEDGKHSINALIPLWDFCNHTSGRITTGYNPQSKCCECFAVRDFKAGEQIFIFYGARTNAELFIHNGFVFEENEHDAYALHLGISKSDPLEEKRIKVLDRINLPLQGEFSLKSGSQPFDGQLLAFLRIFNMNEEQLLEWQEKENPLELQNSTLIFTAEFEKKYWTFILIRLKLILATYKTTLEHDYDLIQKNSLTSNCLLACKMRISEKKILENAIKHVQQIIKV